MTLMEELNNFRDSIKGFEGRRERISNEIKELEKYFQNCGVGIYFDFRLDDFSHLLWCEDDRAKKFRLVYWPADDKSYGQYKPLIECKWQVREEVYPHLKNFVRSFGEHIKDMEGINV